MAFEDKEGLYRRFTRVWHILIILAALVCAPYIFGGSGGSTDSVKSSDIVFGKCFFEGLVFLASFAMNFGMSIWVVFVAGLVMYKNLHVHTFGEIQSKLFPFFFLIGSLTGLAMLFVTVTQARLLAEITSEQFKLIAAVACVALPFVLNGVWFGPKSTEVWMKKHKMEKEEDSDKSKLENNEHYKELKKEFGKLHGITTILSLLSMVANTYVLYWLALQLHNLSAPKVE